jgi:hypothetical protein
LPEAPLFEIGNQGKEPVARLKHEEDKRPLSVAAIYISAAAWVIGHKDRIRLLENSYEMFKELIEKAKKLPGYPRVYTYELIRKFMKEVSEKDGKKFK